MKRKMLAILCTVSTITFAGTTLVSANSETKTKESNSYEVPLANSITNDTQNKFNDIKQRSYYFYDMIPDYFEVQDFMRTIYGDDYINSSPQYRFLTLSKEYFDKYYKTNDINDLDYAITYLFDHYQSVGQQHAYHVNYRTRANQQRAYIPSNFIKDQTDTGKFMMEVTRLVDQSKWGLL